MGWARTDGVVMMMGWVGTVSGAGDRLELKIHTSVTVTVVTD